MASILQNGSPYLEMPKVELEKLCIQGSCTSTELWVFRLVIHIETIKIDFCGNSPNVPLLYLFNFQDEEEPKDEAFSPDGGYIPRIIFMGEA